MYKRLQSRLAILTLPLLAAACGSNVEYAIYPKPTGTAVGFPQEQNSPITTENRNSNTVLSRPGNGQNSGMPQAAEPRPAIARPSFEDAGSARDYILNYPSGAFIQDAKAQFDRLDTAAWQRAQAQGSRSSYKAYLSEFYDGANTQAARQLMASLDDRSTSSECEEFKSSDFGSDATPGSFLAKMRDDRQRELCGT